MKWNAKPQAARFVKLAQICPTKMLQEHTLRSLLQIHNLRVCRDL